MSSVNIMDIGRKWFSISVNFSEEELSRVNTEGLRAAGGKIRYPASGGMRALFHLCVAGGRDKDILLRILTWFGEDGYFTGGMDVTREFAGSSIEPEIYMDEIEKKVFKMSKQWCEGWKSVVAEGVAARKPRVEMMRAVQDIAGGGVGEHEVRAHAEKLLCRKYKSAIFCETVMWRLGWPDLRQPLKIEKQHAPELCASLTA